LVSAIHRPPAAAQNPFSAVPTARLINAKAFEDLSRCAANVSNGALRSSQRHFRADAGF
jgi:hypothetical protein